MLKERRPVVDRGSAGIEGMGYLGALDFDIYRRPPSANTDGSAPFKPPFFPKIPERGGSLAGRGDR